MAIALCRALAGVTVAIIALGAATPLPACCPAPRSGQPVVNADQSVIILWDAATKTQHFIRRASFKSSGEDFGFLVPSPSEPELSESGNEAFPYLQKLTEPETKTMAQPAGGGCGCGAAPKTRGATDVAMPTVRVLQEKEVAGFKATVLEADTAAGLVGWLKDHGYAYSPEIEAWAKPYVGSGWKITAFKIAKPDAKQMEVAASALRMSFRTERPLFPYREPDSKVAADSLAAKHRLLRIYFLSNARFRGELTKDSPWTGKVAWAGKLAADSRVKMLEHLKLPATTLPGEWWLTEFEDDWPYRVAPADVSFARDDDQTPVRRPAIIQYVANTKGDAAGVAMAGLLAVPLLRRLRRVT